MSCLSLNLNVRRDWRVQRSYGLRRNCCGYLVAHLKAARKATFTALRLFVKRSFTDVALFGSATWTICHQKVLLLLLLLLLLSILSLVTWDLHYSFFVFLDQDRTSRATLKSTRCQTALLSVRYVATSSRCVYYYWSADT